MPVSKPSEPSQPMCTCSVPKRHSQENCTANCLTCTVKFKCWKTIFYVISHGRAIRLHVSLFANGSCMLTMPIKKGGHRPKTKQLKRKTKHDSNGIFSLLKWINVCDARISLSIGKHTINRWENRFTRDPALAETSKCVANCHYNCLRVWMVEIALQVRCARPLLLSFVLTVAMKGEALFPKCECNCVTCVNHLNMNFHLNFISHQKKDAQQETQFIQLFH